MRFSVYNYKEFTEADFSVPYLVNPILPRGGIGLIYGKGGHGKTQLVFSLVKAVTEGTPWLGRWEVEEGSVLFIQVDMPKALFQERAQKALVALPNHEKVKLLHTPRLDINTSQARDSIARLVEETKPSLIIYDTLHKLHFEDENDSKASGLVYSHWLDAVGPEVTTVFLHHSRKDFFSREGKPIDSDEDFRGHTSWRDDSDLAIKLRKLTRKEMSAEKAPRGEQWVNLSFSRLRCREQESMILKFNPETLIMEPTEAQPATIIAEGLLRDGVAVTELGKALQERGVSKTHAYRIQAEYTDRLFAKS